MTDKRPRANGGPATAALCLAVVAACLAWMIIAPPLAVPRDQDGGMTQLVLYYATLPRLATALLAGAALALSGAIFQLVLRNPLADPTTLGMSAGANLALVLATAFFPALLGIGRDLVALGGSVVVAGLVIGLGARRGLSPFSLVLAGLVIGLWCGALAAIVTLLNSRYLAGLFIWGAGSLAQQSWDIPLTLLWKLGLVGAGCALLIRPLSLLALGDDAAAGRGLRLGQIRFFAIVGGVALAAFVTSSIGIIGFVGLIAPTLARLAGARRPAAFLPWSCVIGALLLLVADETVQLLSGDLGDIVPTGSVTAIVGAPLLLLLIPKLQSVHRPSEFTIHQPRTRFPMPMALGSALALLALTVTIGLMLGRAPDGGWTWLGGDLTAPILSIRIPRLLSALASGAMLSVAGVILQRLTGNEMAGPEVLGINAGAIFGLAVGIFWFGAAGLGSQLGFAAAGAFAVLAAIFAFSRPSGFAPERILLVGIGLSAMADAIVSVITAAGDPRALLLMRWMSGSTYNVDANSTATVTSTGVILIAFTLLSRRWLDLLPLGAPAAAAAGLSIIRSRLALFGLAGLLSAAATLCVGPFSFVGLMGPHIARELGLQRALPQLAGGAAIGATLMVLADFAGRTAASPYQIPAGLVAALIGAPFLALMLRRKA